ncbi:MAG: hypothetical protein ABT01_02905 [Clostridium sp. SCN 57-10]|nr:MAG: hypothetical protein ABT01_02905 [Clostridium sp. SCN 57-10]
MKRFIALLLILCSLLAGCAAGGSGAQSTEPPATELPKAYGDYRYFEFQPEMGNLRAFDLTDASELAYTLTFNTQTIWPDKMPEGFDSAAFIEWGKNPGLGVSALHERGFTGKGIKVAYIDQPLGKTLHEELTDVDLLRDSTVYEQYEPEFAAEGEPQMHGVAVLSLLAGRSIGVAPDATVYFVENPAWLTDQRTHADSIRRVLAYNETQPENEKVRLVGFSDNIDSSEQYAEEFEAAVKEAEAAGVYVLFCGEFFPAVAEPMSDRDDLGNYRVADWSGHTLQPLHYVDDPWYSGPVRLGIPTDRTTADFTGGYSKWGLGGLSWAAPYAVGVLAMGMQADPTRSVEELLDLLYETAYRLNDAGQQGYGLIDPTAFVDAVLAAKQ